MTDRTQPDDQVESDAITRRAVFRAIGATAVASGVGTTAVSATQHAAADPIHRDAPHRHFRKSPEEFMSNLRHVADRVEIDALRAECTDATMMNDIDRLAGLFTEDAVVRIPDLEVEWVGLEQIRSGFRQLTASMETLVQESHPGALEVTGDSATGRVYISELGRRHDGSTLGNHSIFHDRYRRTRDGWKFTERTYEVRL